VKRLSLLAALAVLALAYAFALSTVIVASARGELVLNEVLYDPDGADEGHEFVELWNSDSVAVGLDGVALEACDGARPGSWSVVWRAPAGAVALPKSPYLVSAAGLATALQNGPDAIRLQRAGAVLDLLGYGDLEDASLSEGEATADAPSGQSLARVRDGIDSGSNGSDWEAASEPTPGQPNHPELRLRFTRKVVRTTPEVVWPGDPVEARLWVRNSGTRAVEASRWRVDADLEPLDGAERSGSVTTPGAAVASGESVLVTVSLRAPAPGLWVLRARLDGISPSGDVADTASASLRSVAGPAVITELAYRDAGVGEWVEIQLLEAVVDFASLSFADDTSTPRAVDRGSVPRGASAGAFLVVAQDPAAVRARFALPESLVLGLAGGWPSLNDGAGGAGGIADRVRVLVGALPSDAVPYAEGRSTRGGSLERLSVGLPSAAAGSWSETVEPSGGTPGRPNSVRAPERGQAPGRGLLVAGTRVLRSRDRGAPAVFRVTDEALGRRLTVRVHDLLGRPLRTLVEGQRFVSDAAFTWDGTDERGAAVAPGLYVVRAEALAEEDRAAISSSVLLAVSVGAASSTAAGAGR
jgi:hypothetical protein